MWKRCASAPAVRAQHCARARSASFRAKRMVGHGITVIGAAGFRATRLAAARRYSQPLAWSSLAAATASSTLPEERQGGAQPGSWPSDPWGEGRSAAVAPAGGRQGRLFAAVARALVADVLARRVPVPVDRLSGLARLGFDARFVLATHLARSIGSRLVTGDVVPVAARHRVGPRGPVHDDVTHGVMNGVISRVMPQGGSCRSGGQASVSHHREEQKRRHSCEQRSNNQRSAMTRKQPTPILHLLSLRRESSQPYAPAMRNR
jgi:hypothetical protein